MNLHELASRLRDVVAPFASARELEFIDDDLFVGEEGEALHLCLYVVSEQRIALSASLVSELHVMRDRLSENDQARLDRLSLAAA